MAFPPACPQIPVADLAVASAYWRDKLGFAIDWTYEGRLAGLSQGEARIFMADSVFRAGLGTAGPALVWLNVASRREVDELYERWRAAGAILASAPEDTPYNLREFYAEDPDGNILRVFYDFGSEARGAEAEAQRTG